MFLPSCPYVSAVDPLSHGYTQPHAPSPPPISLHPPSNHPFPPPQPPATDSRWTSSPSPLPAAMEGIVSSCLGQGRHTCVSSRARQATEEEERKLARFVVCWCARRASRGLVTHIFLLLLLHHPPIIITSPCTHPSNQNHHSNPTQTPLPSCPREERREEWILATLKEEEEEARPLVTLLPPVALPLASRATPASPLQATHPLLQVFHLGTVGADLGICPRLVSPTQALPAYPTFLLLLPTSSTPRPWRKRERQRLPNRCT